MIKQNKMRIFILEDNVIRHEGFKKKFNQHELIIYDNAEEAIHHLINDQNFDYIFLDHDLGGEVFVNSENENTGFQVAKVIQMEQDKGKFKDTKIIVHSLNPIGAQNILRLLPYAKYRPGIWLIGEYKGYTYE